ncbi:hypothetical protein DFJ74DRAFT_314151 [Hyaloraphidium curvatum]|nr:hypothetical protein DFJ74DRAFT_314151 [Hyaloraphidium curvatum]
MEVQHSKQAMLDDVEKELEGRKYGGYQRIYLNVDEQEGNENADANGPARPGPTQNPAPSQAVVHNVTQTHQAKLISFPRGMLRLTLTDGHQVIEGMEMKRLPDVSMYTPLGSKVAITNATLRRGVLELTPNNFAFLGGFIEGMNGPDPLVDIRRKLRAALGKPPATDDDAVSRPMNLPPPPPDPVAPAAPQAGRNAAARPPGNPPPATQHNRQPPPQPPPRQPAPPFPQNNRPPLAPGAQHPRIGTPGFEDFPLDDFGVDDSFDIEDEPPPRAPPPVRQAAPPVRQPPPPRQPAPMPRQPQPPERQPQPPDRHRTPSKAAPGSQKTPQRDCARLWGFQNEQSHSPAQPLPPSSLPVSQQRTPVQERQPPEWEFDADDGLWNELDPDALALSGPGPGGPAAVPSTPLGPRGGTASQSYVDLDDIPDDLLLAMDQLSQKKAPQAPAGTQARPVVNLVDDEEETAGSGRGRTLVQARPPPPASSKQAPKPGLPFAQPLLPRETHAIGDLPNVIRERLAATVWLDNVAIVWYSPFRIVKGSSELELIVIVRDGSGDLAVKLPERVGWSRGCLQGS